jgi:heme exporter protein A
MTDYTVTLDNLVKYFGRRLVFENLSFQFEAGSIYGIAGPNGSGKSTLVKIIANVISPTSGKVNHLNSGKKIEPEELHDYIGFISPYLFLYDEFTANENLAHFSSIRGIKFDANRAAFLLDALGLYDRRNDIVRGYSSGMKQRLKLIFALLHFPRLLILDEPTSNLDNSGKDKFYELIEAEGKKNLVLVASNEEADLALCSEVIKLDDYKRKI